MASNSVLANIATACRVVAIVEVDDIVGMDAATTIGADTLKPVITRSNGTLLDTSAE